MQLTETPAYAGEDAPCDRLSAKPTNRIGDLIDELTARKNTQQDIRTNTRDIAISQMDGSMHLGDGRRYELRDHAFTQLCNRLQVPTQYAKRCDPDLRARNLNRWMNERDRELLIRTEGDEVRAVLSATYRPINHLQILEWMVDLLGDDIPVRYELTDKYLDLQVVGQTPMQRLDDNGSEGLHGGLHLRNSEVGAARVEVSTLVYRSICLNGLILNSGRWAFGRRHVGKERLVEKVKGAFDHALTMASQAASRFLDARGIQVFEPEAVINRIAKHYDLSDAEKDAAQHAYTIEPQKTLYGVINSLTRAGNSVTLSLESRHRLQELGGRISVLSSEGQRWLDN